MRYVIVFNNIVENIVEWDGVSPSELAPGRATFPAQNVLVNIGWQWNNGSPVDLNPPPPPFPSVDLSNLDNLEKAIKAAVLAAAIMSGKTPADAKAAFKKAWDQLSSVQPTSIKLF